MRRQLMLFPILAALMSPSAALTAPAEEATRIGGFVGARLALRFGSSATHAPRLGIVGSPVRHSSTMAGNRHLLSEGLELDLRKPATPTLRLGGLSLAEHRSAIAGGNSTLLIGGGAVALGALALVVLSGDGDGCEAGLAPFEGQCVAD